MIRRRPHLKLVLTLASIAAAGVGLWCSTNLSGSSSPVGGTADTTSQGSRSAREQKIEPPETGTKRNRAGNEKEKNPFNVPSNLTPAQASDLLGQAPQLFPNVYERSIYCCAILRSLCESGYSEEAWSMIEQNVGTLRRGQLSQFFASAQLSDAELLEKMRDDPTELTASLRGYVRRFDASELKSLIQSGKLQNALGDLQKSQIEGALVTALQLESTKAEKKDLAEIFKSAADLYNAKLMDERAFYDILNRKSVGDSFERWDLLESSGFNGGGRDREFRNAMITGMIDNDADRAMEVLRRNTRGVDLGDLGSAMSTWLQNDSQAANTWYQKNQASFTPSQKNVISEANFSLALEFSELDTAQSWLNTISDSEMKTRLTQRLNEAREKSSR